MSLRMPSKYDNQLLGKNCNDCCSVVGSDLDAHQNMFNLQQVTEWHPVDNRELPTVENS